MLSGRGLCDELITRPEESYRLWCVVVYDLETSRIGAPYIYDLSNLRVNRSLVDECVIRINKEAVLSYPLQCRGRCLEGMGKTMLKHNRHTWILDLNSNHSFLMYKFFSTPKHSVSETDRNDLHCKLIVSTGEEIISAIY